MGENLIMETLLILLLAIALDLAFGEPPNAIHPVFWMGKAASFLLKVRGGRYQATQFLWGMAVVLATMGVFGAAAYFILFYLKSLSVVAYVIIGAVLLKSAFSLKELRKAALRVKGLLLREKLDEAHYELRSLVSRDTRDLSKSL